MADCLTKATVRQLIQLIIFTDPPQYVRRLLVKDICHSPRPNFYPYTFLVLDMYFYYYQKKKINKLIPTKVIELRFFRKNNFLYFYYTWASIIWPTVNQNAELKYSTNHHIYLLKDFNIKKFLKVWVFTGK